MENLIQSKVNYCRLPSKSRAEQLFDQIVALPALSDLSNNFNPSREEKVKSKPKKRVQIVTYSGKKGDTKCDKDQPGPKRTRLRKKDPPKCTKEAVLEAFLAAGLPDFDEIAALPLNVVVMDERKEEMKKQPKKTERVNKRQIIKPFVPLLEKIDTISRENSLSNNLPEDEVSQQESTYEPDRSLKYARRSILETAHSLHAEGKSCRTIIHEPSKSRRVTRRNATLDSASVNFLAAFEKTFIGVEDHHDLTLTAKEKVLSLCAPPNITTFNNALDEALVKAINKIGEGSYGEVFKSKTEDDQEVVVKIVPLVTHTGEEDTWKQVLPELVISLTFGELRTGHRNRTPNFINTLRASCASGIWPKELVDAWEEYHLQKISENVHPLKYGPKSNWLILLLNNGGIELENYPFTNAKEALSVILQTTISLAAAEEEFEFEHRDLHTGNVLVMPCEESQLEYKVNNKVLKIPSTGLKISVIDFTLARMAKDGYTIFDDLSKYEDIFTGEGDYQFEVYRLMRKANHNDWKSFTPFTNILWVHYLVTKMITDKTYRSRSKVHQAALKTLKSLKDNIQSYSSTSLFVQSPYFSQILSKLT